MLNEMPKWPMRTSISKDESQQLKGIAILMMVFLHLFPSEEVILRCTNYLWIGHHPFVYMLRKLTTMVVPLYLFLGGYGLYATYCRRQGRMGNAKRVALLYLNYWLVFAIFIPLGCWLNPALYPAGAEGNGTMIYNLFGLSCSYNFEWWFFLPYVVLTAVSQPLIRCLSRTGWRADCGFLVAAFGLLVLAGVLKKGVPYVDAFLPLCYLLAVHVVSLLFAFLSGLFFAKHKVIARVSAWMERRGLKPKHALIFLLLLCLLRMNIGNSGLFNPFFVVLLVAAYVLCCPRPKWLEDGLLLLGRHSTNMWLCHTFFIKYFFGEAIYALRYPLVMFLVTVLVSLSASFLLNIFLTPAKRGVSRLFPA